MASHVVQRLTRRLVRVSRDCVSVILTTEETGNKRLGVLVVVVFLGVSFDQPLTDAAKLGPPDGVANITTEETNVLIKFVSVILSRTNVVVGSAHVPAFSVNQDTGVDSVQFGANRVHRVDVQNAH